jgi:hypothetical protein
VLDPEASLRQALAARGCTLRSATIVRHVSIPDYRAIVVDCEGHGQCFDVFSSAGIHSEDWRWWVATHCDACAGAPVDGAAMATGDQARTVGGRD